MTTTEAKSGMLIKHTIKWVNGNVEGSSTRHGKILTITNESALVEIANYGEIVKESIPLNQLQMEQQP